MIERIRKKYAMTEKGAKDYVAAVFWSVLVNIRKICVQERTKSILFSCFECF